MEVERGNNGIHEIAYLMNREPLAAIEDGHEAERDEGERGKTAETTRGKEFEEGQGDAGGSTRGKAGGLRQSRWVAQLKSK